MKRIFDFLLIFALAGSAAMAQDEAPPPMPDGQVFTDAQLQQLLGPIALYPDPLIAIMLPAAAEPTQIVMADRYVSGGGDPAGIDQQPWDPNVQALAHYPDVLKWMDNNLNWTTQLGEAFQDQQQDVMNAIQELRADAYNLGNLQSTPQEQVVDDNGDIEILPANPDDVYVPDYQPGQVYYDQPDGTPFITFGVGFAIGPWLCGDFDWRAHHLIFWDRNHPRPTGWWHERPEQRDTFIASGHAPVWNPNDHRVDNRAYQGDRGYNNNLPWTSPAANRRKPERAAAPAPAEHPNAFIGIQSARDTRDYSNRGERSMQTMPAFRNLGGFHGGGSAPQAHPAAPRASHFNGGGPPAGGGFHGGGSSGGGNRGGSSGGGNGRR